MKLEEQLTETLKLITKVLNDTNDINKRLTNAFIVAIVAFSLCFSITIVGITYLYFRSDYQYGTINQTQGNSSTANINMKGDVE